jgi:hypothetical protein
VLPVYGGNKEWYLYAARAGLLIGVTSHRCCVSLNTIAHREVAIVRSAPAIKMEKPAPPFSSMVVRDPRYLAA